MASRTMGTTSLIGKAHHLNMEVSLFLVIACTFGLGVDPKTNFPIHSAY
jgi:hypothetical protein